MTWKRGERRAFTEEDDATIKRVRSEGGKWGDCAVAIGRPFTDGSIVQQRARTANLPCYAATVAGRERRAGIVAERKRDAVAAQGSERRAFPNPHTTEARHVPTLSELVPLPSLQ